MAEKTYSTPKKWFGPKEIHYPQEMVWPKRGTVPLINGLAKKRYGTPNKRLPKRGRVPFRNSLAKKR